MSKRLLPAAVTQLLLVSLLALGLFMPWERVLTPVAGLLCLWVLSLYLFSGLVKRFGKSSDCVYSIMALFWCHPLMAFLLLSASYVALELPAAFKLIVSTGINNDQTMMLVFSMLFALVYFTVCVGPAILLWLKTMRSDSDGHTGKGDLSVLGPLYFSAQGVFVLALVGLLLLGVGSSQKDMTTFGAVYFWVAVSALLMRLMLEVLQMSIDLKRDGGMEKLFVMS